MATEWPYAKPMDFCKMTVDCLLTAFKIYLSLFKVIYLLISNNMYK